jgi:hypothetical protein
MKKKKEVIPMEALLAKYEATKKKLELKADGKELFEKALKKAVTTKPRSSK